MSKTTPDPAQARPTAAEAAAELFSQATPGEAAERKPAVDDSAPVMDRHRSPFEIGAVDPSTPDRSVPVEDDAG